MREIKIRAWEKRNQRMANVTEIKWQASHLYHQIKTQITVNDRKIDEWYLFDFEGNSNGIILMQYTGLKDNNGRDIYEGDIFDYGDRKYVVEFDKERAGFYPFAKDDGCGCCTDEVVWNSGEGEVIGNIYENPELLE